MVLNSSTVFFNQSSQSNWTSQPDDITYVMEVYVYRTIYVVGILGNTFTAVVWIKSKVKVSPVCYFIALSIADNLVLLTHALETQHTIDSQGLCQMVHMVFFAVPIFAILLVLGMSTERYLEICHPMVGKKYVNLKRTRRTIVSLAVFSVCLSPLEGYIWTTHSEEDVFICVLRNNLGPSFIWIYGVCVLTLFFLFPLICVVVLNVLVIVNLNKSRRRSSAYGRSMEKPSKASFNTSFLVVSLYLALSELVYAIVHLTFYLGPEEGNMWPLSGIWRKYETKPVSLLFADAVALSSYALDLTGFTLSSKTFRKGAIGLFNCRKKETPNALARNLLARPPERT